MTKHVDILIDASGSMGYMKDSEQENQYLLPDGSTRMSLAKKVVKDLVSKQLSSYSSITLNTFNTKYHLTINKKRIIKTKKIKDANGNLKLQKYYSDYPNLDKVYSGEICFPEIKQRINTIKDPKPGGSPIFWAISIIINQSENNIDLIVLSDGDANDKTNFDNEILKLIQETKKDITIHLIGIAQNKKAQIKCKNLADKTGGIYINLLT